jgi:hypothetical protein
MMVPGQRNEKTKIGFYRRRIRHTIGFVLAELSIVLAIGCTNGGISDGITNFLTHVTEAALLNILV